MNGSTRSFRGCFGLAVLLDIVRGDCGGVEQGEVGFDRVGERDLLAVVGIIDQIEDTVNKNMELFTK